MNSTTRPKTYRWSQHLRDQPDITCLMWALQQALYKEGLMNEGEDFSIYCRIDIVGHVKPLRDRSIKDSLITRLRLRKAAARARIRE